MVMSENPVRLAMWSGPRNISTAMMRAWETRSDTAISDEPFYGYYLEQTGIEHPGRNEIIASMATDWRRIVREITGPVPGGRAVWYQKHMTHHILPEICRDWMNELQHCFLIRHPQYVVASYGRVRSEATAEDLGYPQQAEIFDQILAYSDMPPPVLDSMDVLANPHKMLVALCAALDLPFTKSMLRWRAGTRATDGVWAKYWYTNVEASTGFMAACSSKLELSDTQKTLADTCLPFYERLYKFRISAE
tara:strand:+ start:1317 stop:2063 length:747 start_codon:yes stop_codon:yes gene_type:complete